MMPTTTESNPSKPNSHCQPRKPRTSWRLSSIPAIGPESAAATEEPAMKMAVALPRWPAGTQRAK